LYLKSYHQFSANNKESRASSDAE